MAVWKHESDDVEVSVSERAGSKSYTAGRAGSLHEGNVPGGLSTVYEKSFIGDPESQDLLPEGILNMFLTQANDSVLPSRWGSMWRYAAGLYLAHFSTMYLKTYAPASSGTAQVVAKAQPAGVIKSTTMGDTSVSYDNSAVTIGTEKWGSWNATQYGQQLVTLARLVGMGGMYVI